MQKRKEKHTNIWVILLTIALLLPNIASTFHLFHHDEPTFVKSDITLLQQSQPDCHCCDLQLTPAFIFNTEIAIPEVSENYAAFIYFTDYYIGQYTPLHFQLRAPPVLS